MNHLAVIPARANSTRLPGKNTMLIAGKSTLAWTIQHLRECTYPLRIVVVSDDDKAHEIAEAEGVEAVWEPESLVKQDNLFRVVEYVLEWAGEYDRVLMAYPEPVRPPGLFDRMIEKMDETGCDVVNVLARVESHQHPLFYSQISNSGDIIPLALCQIGNSQDFTPVYSNTGAGSLIVASDVPGMAHNRAQTQLTQIRRAVIIEPGESVDLDTLLDAKWAEFLLCQNQATSSAVPSTSTT